MTNINNLEVTMPDGVEAKVMEGLTDAEKTVVLTATQGQSLMFLIEYAIKQRGIELDSAPGQAIVNMATDMFDKAMTYVSHLAQVQDEARFNLLMDRAELFLKSAEDHAKQLLTENSNA